jgi:translation initiation factor 2 gamma subunit (eIF-2gamma)
LGVFGTVPDADDVASESRRQKIVEEHPDEVGLDQEEEGDVVALGSGQDPPAMGADQKAGPLERKSQSQPPPGDSPEFEADVLERRLGQEKKEGEDRGAEEKLEKEEDALSLDHWNFCITIPRPCLMRKRQGSG